MGVRHVALALASLALFFLACGGEDAGPAPDVVPIVEPAAPPGGAPASTATGLGQASASPSAPGVSPPPASAASPSPAAAPVVLVPGLADRARIALGSARGFAIGADGRVYEFPLAAGSASAMAQPVDGVEHAESVATHGAFACVVTSERRVVCWGRGRPHEQIANIDTTPAPIDAFVNAQAVVVTSTAVCARDGAGAVTCLGRRLIDDRERTDSVFSFPLPRAAVQLAGATHAVCAVLDDGALHCMGGIGHYAFTGTGGPRAVRTPFPVGSVAMHTDNICVRRADSNGVACGGDVGEWFYEDLDYEDDERGPVSAMEAPVDAFTLVDVPDGVTALATNVNHACAMLRGGGVRCWGTPYRDGRTEGFVARAATGLRGVTELVAGGGDRRGYTCAIQGDLPVCFTSERVLARGTPGQPRFTICRAEAPDGTCVELQLAPRGRAGAPPAAPQAAPSEGAMATTPATPNTPNTPNTPVTPGCVVADPSGTPLNVRADASSRAPVVGTLENGTAVTIDQTRGRFRHLTAPVVGWAWSDNLACP